MSGTVVVTAGVSDSAGIASVQFAVDGVNVSTPVTTSPYTYSWNTTAVSNGTHTLTALATDSVGNTATSGGVTVTVSNTSSSSPITIDAHVSTHGSTATTISSPSFSTLAANELLVAYVGSDGPNGAKSQTFSSVTGGGLTWTMRERADGQPGDAEIWQAVAPTPLTGITVTATRSAGAYQGSLSVVSYIGASTTINGSVSTQSGASGAPSVSLTTTANNSWVWGVGNDWDNAVARTIGPNQTMFDQFVDTGTGDTFWTQYQTGQNLASGTAVTINDTTPTGDSWNLAAIEIVPSGGSTPPPPPPPPVLPSVPTNLSATAVNGSLVDLSWTASTDVNGVDGYDVYRNGSLLGVTTATTYADATVTAGTTYSYTVAAYDALGNTSARSRRGDRHPTCERHDDLLGQFQRHRTRLRLDDHRSPR